MRASKIVCGAAVVVVAAVASRPTDAATSPARGALVVTAFVQGGRTDVWRNEVLEFRFSAPLRRGSVGERTLMIGRVAPEGFYPAPGARIVSGNVVRFDTRRTQANYDASQRKNAIYVESDRPEGLMGYSAYTVRIPATPGAPTLRTRDGRPISQSFTSTFTTSDRCVDAVEGQPWFIGDHGTGLLGFDPPRGEANGLVEANASIVLEFSEPVLSTSLVPGTTVLVRSLNTGAPIAGTIAADSDAPSGRRYLFTPTTTFGSFAPGYGTDFDVRLTTGITDIAGNPLKRAFGSATFRSRAPQ